jgi:uncharacterized membrane protein
MGKADDVELATPAGRRGAPALDRRLRMPTSGRRLHLSSRLLLPGVAGLALFAWLTAYGLNFYDDVRPAYDVGYFSQAAWLVQHGETPLVTVRGLHLLGDHTYYLFLPMALLIAPFPTAQALLVGQALILAVAVFPLAAFARRVAGLGEKSTAAVLGAYVFYPALQNLGAVEFHPEVLAVPLFLGAMLYAGTGRWRPYTLCVAAVLLTREDLAITVTMLGLVLLVTGEVHAGQRRAGAWTAAAGVAAWLINTQLVLPYFSGTYVQTERMSRYGDGVAEIAAFLVTNPVTVVTDQLTGDALTIWVALFGPLLFLPLLAPRWVLPALPLQALFLLSDRPTAEVIERQYVAQAIPFFLAAAAVGLASVQAYGRRRGWRGFPSGLAPALVAATVLSWATWSTTSPRAEPGWERADATDRALVEAIDLVPDGAAVAGTDRTWPRLADRIDLYNFPSPYTDFAPPRDARPVADRQADLDWVVVDSRDNAGEGSERAAWVRRLREQGWRTVYAQHGVVVLAAPRDSP